MRATQPPFAPPPVSPEVQQAPPPPPPRAAPPGGGQVPPYAAPLEVTRERELRWPWIIAGAVGAGVFGFVGSLAAFFALVAGSGCLIGCGDPQPLTAALLFLAAAAGAALSGACAAMVVRGGRWPRRSTAALAVALPATMLVLTLLVARIFTADPAPPVGEAVLAALAVGAWAAWIQWGRMHRLRDIVAVMLVVPLTVGILAGMLGPVLAS